VKRMAHDTTVAVEAVDQTRTRAHGVLGYGYVPRPRRMSDNEGYLNGSAQMTANNAHHTVSLGGAATSHKNKRSQRRVGHRNNHHTGRSHLQRRASTDQPINDNDADHDKENHQAHGGETTQFCDNTLVTCICGELHDNDNGNGNVSGSRCGSGNGHRKNGSGPSLHPQQLHQLSIIRSMLPSLHKHVDGIMNGVKF